MGKTSKPRPSSRHHVGRKGSPATGHWYRDERFRHEVAGATPTAATEPRAGKQEGHEPVGGRRGVDQGSESAYSATVRRIRLSGWTITEPICDEKCCFSPRA